MKNIRWLNAVNVCWHVYCLGVFVFLQESFMKSFKFALLAVATAAVMAPAHAQGLTYSVGVFSANTDDTRKDDVRPSVVLGANYDFGNGFYAVADYTTGKFEGQAKARGELALSVGYGNELANGIYYDVAATRTMYKTSGDGNELGLTLGYGPVSVTYTKAFTTSGFTGTHTLDYTLQHNLTEAFSAGVTLTTTKGEADTYEIFGAYDLGNNLSLSASIFKDKPKLVVGITKSF